MHSVALVLLVGCSDYGLTVDPPGYDLTSLQPNIDTDGDGIPDLNIDTDGDGIPDIDIDLDNDGVPDINLDLDGDGLPDVDIDTDGDGIPDVDIDVDGDGVPDVSLDTDGDGYPDVDIDTDGDGVPDVSIDTDGDGVPDINIDSDGDGYPDVDIDTDGDGVPDINIDTDGDGEPELDIDTDGDGDPDINIDNDGDGFPDENLTDTFVVPELSDVDIVFYGDTSGSMEAELAQLGSRISEFTNRLSAEGGNWQLAAVTGDDGCAVDQIFTPDTPGWEARFAQALLVQPYDEETDERGLEIVSYSVEAVGPGECNEGLLRPNALLHVIFLSDENDESGGWDSFNPTYWQSWVDRIQASKGSIQGLSKLSAIAGPTPFGCAGADPGFGYWGAVTATGGTFLSICQDWENQLDILAQASVQTEFPLTVRADPSTIEVVVNGQVRPPSDWAYDNVTNSVAFVANEPGVNDTVEIRYEAN